MGALLVSRNVDEARGRRAIGLRDAKLRYHVQTPSPQLQAHLIVTGMARKPHDLATMLFKQMNPGSTETTGTCRQVMSKSLLSPRRSGLPALMNGPRPLSTAPRNSASVGVYDRQRVAGCYFPVILKDLNCSASLRWRFGLCRRPHKGSLHDSA